MELDALNFKKGFLIDDELLVGLSEAPGEPGHYLAYVIRHETAETADQRKFTSLESALEAVRALQSARPSLRFESASSCGDCAEGQCAVDKGGSCRKAQPSSLRSKQSK